MSNLKGIVSSGSKLMGHVSMGTLFTSTGEIDPILITALIEEYLRENPPAPGAPGEPGEPGKDGYSPTVSASAIEGGYRITIVNVNGTETLDILHGTNGVPGAPGEQGPQGAPGKDGYSPTVVVTEVDGGYQINFTDVNGTETVTILHGKDGEKGEDGYTPLKGKDYFTESELQQVAQEAASLVSIDQVTPDKVIFPNGATTTYAIGKVTLTNGMGTLVEPGGTLVDFFNNFVDEKNPSTTQPSVSLTFSQAGSYEVGSNVTPSWSASLNAGSYTYGPATGIKPKSWAISDTAGHSATTASGSFAQFQVTDSTSYTITAKATYDAGSIPVTNTGNDYSAGQIKAGSKSATSSAVSGYRNTFYGTRTAKTDLTSDLVRGLANKSGKALANGSSFTIDVPVGALQVVFAYPATLRDVTSVKDVNGMNAEIASSFTKSTLDVKGNNNYTAISYKVYTLPFANANDTANKFTVTI